MIEYERPECESAEKGEELLTLYSSNVSSILGHYHLIIISNLGWLCRATDCRSTIVPSSPGKPMQTGPCHHRSKAQLSLQRSVDQDSHELDRDSKSLRR